jgi:hypothetical protein
MNYPEKTKMEIIPETHMKGLLSIETDMKSKICDFGIQIASDGRVWICVDGVAFIRFKPLNNKIIKILSAIQE